MAEAEPQLVLHLDGFDGPLDLLLELARGQKVDLARISILSLVEQYLAIVEGARQVRLELAGDWLVMAAWLTWLKSRLLLPVEQPDGDGEEAAGLLASRLGELEHIQAAARWLMGRTQLGHEVWARGAPEQLVAVDRSELKADLAGLMLGYVAARRRGGAKAPYVPKRRPIWTVADALARLGRMLGRTREWRALDRFLPHVGQDAMLRRGALASTLVAGLELARKGTADLRQDVAFGPILVRSSPGA